MTVDTIKQAVYLLDDPILIIESKTVEDSIVIFGEVYTETGHPVMISVLLKPKNKKEKFFIVLLLQVRMEEIMRIFKI